MHFDAIEASAMAQAQWQSRPMVFSCFSSRKAGRAKDLEVASEMENRD
jgi:hypothetical protein